jgi:hypothetical protein
MYSWYKRKQTCLLHCGTREYTNIYISLVVQEEPHLSSMVEQVETQLYGLMELKKMGTRARRMTLWRNFRV